VINDRVILLVEDNRDDEILTIRALRKSQIANSVVVARDGVEALDYLFGTGTYAGRDTSVQPQLVLLDLNMPRVGGIVVLERLRSDERTQFVPVVVLTSSKEDEHAVDSYARGANAFVRKPVKFDELVVAMRVLGLFWLVINQPAADPNFPRRS
jgi:two-component system, response regulator